MNCVFYLFSISNKVHLDHKKNFTIKKSGLFQKKFQIETAGCFLIFTLFSNFFLLFCFFCCFLLSDLKAALSIQNRACMYLASDYVKCGLHYIHRYGFILYKSRFLSCRNQRNNGWWKT